MQWMHLLNVVAIVGTLAPLTSAHLPPLGTLSSHSAAVPLAELTSELDEPFAPQPRFTSRSTADIVLSPAVLADIQKIVTDNGLPGVALAVVRRGGAQEFASFGVRTEDGDAMTADVRCYETCFYLADRILIINFYLCAQTLFTIASCSKAFLTAALGLLMDDYAHGRNMTPLPAGLVKLDWDTKLVDVLPGEWALMDEWATEKASLKDIMSHTSGLPRYVTALCGKIRMLTR
jgi:CubicO group peptidase (beta-lactamase class C family)